MAHICERYAHKFDVLFNLKKSQIMIYKAYQVTSDPCVTINGIRVKCVDTIIHLGHLLTENVYEFNMSKYIDNFNRPCNILVADFKYRSSQIRNVLFQRYGKSFDGTQMLPHFDTNIEDVYTA